MMRAHGWIRLSRRSLLPPCRGRRRRSLLLLVTAILVALPGGVVAWEAHFGETDRPASGLAVTFDAEGNVIAGGYTHVAGDYGYGTVVKIAPDGSLFWKHVDANGSEVQSVHVVADGDVIVGGTTNALDETDNGQPTATRLDGETGAILWRHVDPRSHHQVKRILTDGDGNVVTEFVRWRDETREDSDFLRRKLSGDDGTVLWETTEGWPYSSLVAIDPGGDFYVDGCPTLVKRSGADGRVLWQRDLPGLACVTWGGAIGLDGEGNIVVASGDTVSKVSGLGGDVIWSRRVRGLPRTRLHHLSIDPGGDVVVAGSTSQGARRHAPLSSDVFVAKLSGSGQRLWQRRIDGRDETPPPSYGGVEGALGVTVDADRDVVLAAVLHRRGKIRAIVKLDGQRGRRRWVRPIDARSVHLATDAANAIAITGLKHIPVNGWGDLGYGFWVGRLSPDGVGLWPTFLY